MIAGGTQPDGRQSEAQGIQILAIVFSCLITSQVPIVIRAHASSSRSRARRYGLGPRLCRFQGAGTFGIPFWIPAGLLQQGPLVLPVLPPGGRRAVCAFGGLPRHARERAQALGGPLPGTGDHVSGRQGGAASRVGPDAARLGSLGLQRPPRALGALPRARGHGAVRPIHHGKCASFRSSTRRMSSRASCAISGSGKRGCACIPAPTRRAKRPSIRGSTTLPRLRHRTGHGVLRHLKRPAAHECASRTPRSAAPSPPAAAFVTLRPWKRTLSVSDSGQRHRGPKAISYQSFSAFGRTGHQP